MNEFYNGDETKDKDHAISMYFDESDIGSMQMLVNIGSSLIYMVVIACSFLSYFIFWILAKLSPK